LDEAGYQGNLLYNNDKQDLFIEVNHSPYIVDNNILLLSEAMLSQWQGGLTFTT